MDGCRGLFRNTRHASLASRGVAAVVTVALVLQSGTLLADGLYLNGVSARSIGRGGTNQGFADNGGILYDNPAAMTNIEGNGLLEASIDLLVTDFEYSDPQNPGVTDSSATALPQLAAIFKTPDERFAFGIGLFVPAGFTQHYRMNAPAPVGGMQEYQSYGSLIKLLPGAAWQVTDRLSIGGTIGLAYSQIQLRGPYVLQSVGLPTYTDLDADGFGLTASAGLQYELTDTTTLGFTWQSQTSIGLDGDTNVVVGRGLSARYDTEFTIEWPSSLALGVRQEFGKHVFAADATWFNWGDTWDDYLIQFSSPTRRFFPDSVEDPFHLDWHDTVSMRLGYEYDLGKQRTVRLGYVYHPTPIPNSTLTPFIQAITEHAFSCGYGFEFRGWMIDLAYMFTTGDTQRVGTSAFIGGDFDNSVHSAQTHAFCVNFIKRL